MRKRPLTMSVNKKENSNFLISNLILALFCAFLGSVKGLIVSQIESLGPIEIFGLRSGGAVCFILPIIVYGNFQLWYDLKSNLILLLRSVIGNIAVCGYYFGFVYLPIAEASLLFYSTPVYTLIIGFLFLKEKCGAVEIVSIILSLIGVALVCVPDFSFNSGLYSSEAFKGITGSLIGAVAQAAALAIIRKLTHIHPAVVAFWWAMVGIAISTVFSLVQYSTVLWKCGLEQLYIVLIAVVGFVCELLLISALKKTNAVIVSIALTSEILWAFVLQIAVTKEMPNMMVVWGGVAIVLSVLIPPVFTLIYSKCYRTEIINADVKESFIIC